VSALEFRLPDVGEGIDGGELLEWHVRVGEGVSEDQPLAEVQTDKAVITLPCPTDGVIAELRFKPGETIPVGATLAVIETAAPAREAGPLASPATRRLARERGVDLAALAASTGTGRIRREDVEHASTPLAAAGNTVPLRGVRRTIAQRMTEAWQTIPHVFDYRDADATRLLETRETLGLALTPLLVKIASHALAAHPYLNASLDMEREVITLHRAVHASVAVATPDGIVAPVIRDAGAKSLGELAHEVAELTAAARERRLTPGQLRDGTFTVNNYGAVGIRMGTPLIAPPQVANLGVGRIESRALVRDGAVVAAPVVTLSVSGDHRLLDGDVLAAFVTRVVELIEQPALLLEGAR